VLAGRIVLADWRRDALPKDVPGNGRGVASTTGPVGRGMAESPEETGAGELSTTGNCRWPDTAI